MKIDLIALQEPSVNFLNLTIVSKSWTPVYPTSHASSPDKTRSLILVSATLRSESWEQLAFPSGDVTVISFTCNYGKFILFNIY
ncbi:hypothetical protein BC827DRAFT_1133500, partial [Russula dissimulans]